MEESLHHTPHSWPHKQLLYSMQGNRMLPKKYTQINVLRKGGEKMCVCIIEVENSLVNRNSHILVHWIFIMT